MAPDDSEVDSGADAGGVDGPTDPETAPDRPTAHSPESLAARLSTVPSRRAYGMERAADSQNGGLLSPRERQYLRQAERLDDADRQAVEGVVSDRVGEFVDTDWPVIRENCPDVAEALRAELCESDD